MPECLSKVTVVKKLLTDEIYGWMLKTTEIVKAHLPTENCIAISIKKYVKTIQLS